MKKITCKEVIESQEYFARISEAVNILIYDVSTKTGKPLIDLTFRPAWDKWRIMNFSEKKYYAILSILFDEIFENDLINRTYLENPEEFEKDDPESVLRAIWKSSDAYFECEDLIEWLRKQSYIAFTDEKCKNVLIIPLFRDIGLDEKTKKLEFKQGLLHMYQHFSSNGNPISVRSENAELPSDIAMEIANCYFNESPSVSQLKINDTVVSERKFSYDYNEIMEFSCKICDEKYKLIVFHNTNFNVSFLSTFHRVK